MRARGPTLVALVNLQASPALTAVTARRPLFRAANASLAPATVRPRTLPLHLVGLVFATSSRNAASAIERAVASFTSLQLAPRLLLRVFSLLKALKARN